MYRMSRANDLWLIGGRYLTGNPTKDTSRASPRARAPPNLDSLPNFDTSNPNG